MSDNNKKLKSRRSSILKPPKPRNPLSDVDLNPPTEATFMKSRRVSFANVHFKKEFTADPEKNTIWHNSYEEEMNKSDKSDLTDIKSERNTLCNNEQDINMSVEDMSLDSDVMNYTQVVQDFDNSIETALANNSDSSISSAVIDLTKHHNNKAPMCVNIQNHPNFDEVQESYHISETVFVDTIPEGANENYKRQTIYFQTENENVEFTETVPSNFNVQLKQLNKPNRQTINFNTHPHNAEMEMTQLLTSETNFNNEPDGETMEITKSIPSHIRNQNKHLQTQKRQTINFKTHTEHDGNMDLTQAVSVQNQENKFPINRHTINFSETENNELEFTEYISSNRILNQNKKRETINFNSTEAGDDMNMTHVISKELEKENILAPKYSQKRQTINLKINPENEGSVDLTQTVINENINKKTSESMNMEITEVIPTRMIVTDDVDKENIFAPLIRQNKNKPTQKRQTINFNQISEDANMEITEVIPTEMLLACQKVLPVEDKENIPDKENISSDSRRRKTILYNQMPDVEQNMEITQNIPSDLAQNIPDKENISSDSRRRKTILYNQMPDDEQNMEITQNIPSDLAQNIPDKENISSDSRRRKTILFNQMPDDEQNMEITQNIPSDLAQNCASRPTIYSLCQKWETIAMTENIPTCSAQKPKKAEQKNQPTIPNSYSEAENTEKNEQTIYPSETDNFVTMQDHSKIEKTINILDTFNLTKYLEGTDEAYLPESPTLEPILHSQPEEEFTDKSEINILPVDDMSHSKNKIFRFIGQPLIFNPNSEEKLNSSDICQTIKFPGQKDDFSVSKINLTDKLDFTPVNNHNSLNLTDNLTSTVDSTEKLINCKIGLPSSEYSKISEVIDKHYSIGNTSFPENLDTSPTETSEDGKSVSINHICLDESQYKVDSIISVNSSIETVEKMDDIELQYKNIKLPPKIDYNFNEEETLVKLSNQTYEICENIKMLQNIKIEPISAKEIIEKYFNIDVNYCYHQENSTFTVPKYNFDEDKPAKKMFQRMHDFYNKILQKQKANVNIELTLQDKIKRMKNNDTLWDLLPNSEYSFTFMNDKIKFDVQLEPNSEIVKKVEFVAVDESQFKPIGRYIYQIKKVTLTEEKIKSAVGERYTIFSLLDYVSIVGEEFMDILKEYEYLALNIGMKLDENLNAILLFTNISLRLAFEVRFNLDNLNNINPDLFVIKNLVSNIDENALKRLAGLCPPGIAFIRQYHRSVTDYLKVMQKYK